MKWGFILLLGTVAWGQSPGLVASVAQSAIEEFKNQAIPVFLSQLGNLSIPDQDDKIGSGFFSIDVSISQITVSGIAADTANTDLTFSAPDTINLHIGGLSASTTFNWHFSTSIASGGGSGNVAVSNSDVYVSISLGANQGHCTITIDSASMNIGNLDISIGGNPLAAVENWIIGLFNGQLKGTIQSAISSAIQQSGQQAIDQLLAQFGISVPIGNTGIGIDYDLVEPPSVQSDHITVSSLAMFIDVNSPNYSPPIPSADPLPAYDPNGDQIQIAISDFTLNSGLYAAYAAGRLQYTITPEMIPSSSPVQLDTTSLDSLFPGIEATYGPNLPCSVACQAGNQSPLISSTQSDPSVSGDITGTAVADCTVLVSGTTEALGLAISLAFNATVSLNNWEVLGSVNSAEVLSVTAYSSTLNQEIDTSGLMFMINMGLGLAVPYLDQTVLGPGIQLPHIQNLDLSDGSVMVGNGFIYVEATPQYVITTVKRETEVEMPLRSGLKLVYA